MGEIMSLEKRRQIRFLKKEIELIAEKRFREIGYKERALYLESLLDELRQTIALVEAISDEEWIEYERRRAETESAAEVGEGMASGE